jgi:hypothetical protein
MVYTRAQLRRSPLKGSHIHIDRHEKYEENDSGYIHLRSVVHASKEEKSYIRSVAVSPIFNNSGRKNDRLRRQGLLKKDMIPNILEQTQNIIDTLYPSLFLSDSVVLVSLPGCAEQKPHTDYDANSLNGISSSVIPRGVLVALEENTTLEVWPGSHDTNKRGIQKRTIRLDSGDVIIFRGDVVHAGSAYKSENTRIHIFADHPSFTRSANRTYLVGMSDL